MKNFKKIIAVLLVLVMLGSFTSAIAYAASADTAVEEATDVAADDGKIKVESWKQLKFAIIFKLIDKVFKFFQDLFSGQRKLGNLFA